MTEATMSEQLEELFDDSQPATPNSVMAILWMDTAYRLAAQMLRRDNNVRAKEGKPPLVPGLRDLNRSMEYIGSFDSYFQEATENEDGTINWASVDRNKVGLGSIQYRMLSEETSALIANAESLKGVNLGETAKGVIDERGGGDIYLPDTSGPVVDAFAQPMASKIAFYGFKLISLLRANGGAQQFGPKSQSTLSDIIDLVELQVEDLEEVRDDPEDIDHLSLNWDIMSGEQLKPKNVFTLSGVELAEAITLKAAFDAWMKAYEQLHDENATLREEIEYQVAQAKAYVDNQRKQSTSPVHGVERKANS